MAATSRGRRAAPALAAALALVLLPSAAIAQGAVVMWPGFDRSDPVGSAAKRLVELVRERCSQVPYPVTMGMDAFAGGATGLTSDQQFHVAQLIHSALSRQEGVQLSPFKDLAGILSAQQVGLTDAPDQAEIRRMLERLQIRVIPSGSSVGQVFRLSLRAVGMNRIDCDVSTDLVELPPSLTGEQFLTLEELFTRSMLQLRNRARGQNELAVRALQNGEPIPPYLASHFERELSVAISRTADKADVNLGNPTVLEIAPPNRPQSESRRRWDARIDVDERRNGFRITIDLSRPGETPIAHRGLVRPEELPALRRSDLAAGRGGRGSATELNLRAAMVRVADAVNDRMPSQRYSFRLDRPSIVEIDVPQVNRRLVPINPVLVDQSGRPQAHINPPGDRVNLRRYRLAAGGYEIAIAAPSRGGHEFMLTARAAPISEMLAPEPPGRLTGQFGDWYVGQIQRDSQRFCYAFTPAQAVEPEGWREQAPVIWMGITNERGGPLSHYLDLGDRYQPGAPLEVSIVNNGKTERVPVAVLGRHINPVKLGRSGEPVLDPEAIRAYTSGGLLRVSGISTEGRDTRVTYSLDGYRSAASAMAMACNRVDFARDLVWR